MPSPVFVRFLGLALVQKALADSTKNGLRAGLRRGALILSGQIARTARVQTGRLRSSWTAADPQVTIVGNRGQVIIGTNVKYAPFVGRKDRSTSHKGAGEAHAEEAFKEARARIEKAIGFEIEASF